MISKLVLLVHYLIYISNVYCIDLNLGSSVFQNKWGERCITDSVVSFLNKGVAPRTLDCYNKNSEDWVSFLMQRFQCCNASEALHNWMFQLNHIHQQYLLIDYIIYLNKEKGLADERISNILSGIRHYMRVHTMDISCFDSETVRLAVRATRLSPREQSLIKEKRKRLPITTDMVIWLKEKYWKHGLVTSREDIDQRMTFLGVMIGMTFLRRVSEYTVDGRSNHTLLSDDVTILRKRGLRSEGIPPWAVTSCHVGVDEVESIRFIFRSSKTDQGGRGLYLFLKNESDYERELIKCILNWCIFSGTSNGKPFLSRLYKNRSKVLRPCMVNTMLKEVADQFGFSHVRGAFTSHSLRIGGATLLMANGVGRDTIQRIGGWAAAESASDSIYELNTPHDESNLWSALSSSPSKNHISTRDLVSILPPTQNQCYEQFFYIFFTDFFWGFEDVYSSLYSIAASILCIFYYIFIIHTRGARQSPI